MNRNTLVGPLTRSCHLFAAAGLLLVPACDADVDVTVNINVNATAAGATDGTTGEPSTTGGLCPEDQIECEGLVARVCDGMGGYKSETPCDLACTDSVGCTVCEPGATRCAGQTSEVCKDDGTGWEVAQDCDSVQDLVCDPDSGQCLGACAGLDPSNIGCDFYPVVTRQYAAIVQSFPSGYAVTVVNTSDEPADLTITRGSDLVATETVEVGETRIITLPWVDGLALANGGSQVVADGAYRLRSTRPVTVYQYNPLNPGASADASLLLPVTTWTGNYVVASWPKWSDFPGWYSVTASADDTTVTVTAPGVGVATQAGGGVDLQGNGVVVLDEGDVLQVLTSGGGDPTGVLISADKPVQVHGGHECANVPLDVGYCDHLEESIPPIESLATQYVVAPPAQEDGLSDKAIVVRIVAAEANTSLTFEPDLPVSHFIADAGGYVEIPTTDERFVVSADKKILVAEYMVGQSAGYGVADPAMLIATPTAQFRSDYRFYAEPGWPNNFVDIVAPAGASVVLDGDSVDSFAPVVGTGFVVARVPLAATGGHSVSADEAVGISVRGVADYTSYWYPGGLDLADIP